MVHNSFNDLFCLFCLSSMLLVEKESVWFEWGKTGILLFRLCGWGGGVVSLWDEIMSSQERLTLQHWTRVNVGA